MTAAVTQQLALFGRAVAHPAVEISTWEIEFQEVDLVPLKRSLWLIVAVTNTTGRSVKIVPVVNGLGLRWRPFTRLPWLHVARADADRVANRARGDQLGARLRVVGQQETALLLVMEAVLPLRIERLASVGKQHEAGLPAELAWIVLNDERGRGHYARPRTGGLFAGVERQPHLRGSRDGSFTTSVPTARRTGSKSIAGTNCSGTPLPVETSRPDTPFRRHRAGLAPRRRAGQIDPRHRDLRRRHSVDRNDHTIRPRRAANRPRRKRLPSPSPNECRGASDAPRVGTEGKITGRHYALAMPPGIEANFGVRRFIAAFSRNRNRCVVRNLA